MSRSDLLRSLQEPCQSPDAPQEFVGWQENEIIVLKDAQGVIQDLQWRDSMGLPSRQWSRVLRELRFRWLQLFPSKGCRL